MPAEAEAAEDAAEEELGAAAAPSMRGREPGGLAFSAPPFRLRTRSPRTNVMFRFFTPSCCLSFERQAESAASAGRVKLMLPPSPNSCMMPTTMSPFLILPLASAHNIAPLSSR